MQLTVKSDVLSRKSVGTTAGGCGVGQLGGGTFRDQADLVKPIYSDDSRMDQRGSILGDCRWPFSTFPPVCK